MNFEEFLAENKGPGHRFAVTVSDPNHAAVSQRKTQIQRHINIHNETDKAAASERAKKHYQKAGFKVHSVEHHSELK